MISTLDKHKLTRFVRTTLGCGCPDAVFDKIDSSWIALGGLVGASARIVVGDTLLIYVVYPTSIQELHEHIAEIASEGGRDRDMNQYNRFRLVVPDDSGASRQQAVAAGFAEEAGSDEKMHIHFVDPAVVLDLYEPRRISTDR